MSQLKPRNELVDQIDDSENDEDPEGGGIDPDYLVPSGSTHLNCCMSDNPYGGYGLGKIANIVGDSFTGKTLLALTALAECAITPRFDEFDLFYDDSEASCEFDILKMFPPLKNRLRLVESNTVEELYTFLLKLVKNRKPFIYFQDSVDALTSEEEMKRVQVKYLDEKKKETGSYKTEKPKMFSEMLRVLKKDIKSVEGFIGFVSQTRDNIGPGAMFRPKVRSGGQALTFYCTHVMWLAVEKSITRGEGRAKVEIGNDVEARVTKNKLTGKKRRAYFPVYSGWGIDDLSSNVFFLMDYGYWKKDKNSIIVPDWDFKGLPGNFVQFAEENNLQEDIRQIVGEVWLEKEEAVRIKRPGRFS